MALNAQPLPAGWIKPEMIVRCTNPIGLMRVRHIHEDGDVDALRARSSKLDVFKGEAARFAPATIEDYIVFHLDTWKFGNYFTPTPHGKDERNFNIHFRARLETADIDKLKPIFDKVDSSQNPYIIVTVPQKWLDELVIVDPVTPAVAARAQAEAAQVVEQAAAAVSVPIESSDAKSVVSASAATVDWFIRSFARHDINLDGVKIVAAKRWGQKTRIRNTWSLFFTTIDSMAGVGAAAGALGLEDIYLDTGRRILTVDLPDDWTSTFGESHEKVSTRNAVEEVAAENVADNVPAAPEYDPDKAEKEHLLSDAYGNDDNSLSPDDIDYSNEPSFPEDELPVGAGIIRVEDANWDDLKSLPNGKPAPDIDDEDLVETARLIAELRDRLQKADARIGELKAEREELADLAEQRQEIIDSLLEDAKARDLLAQDALETAEIPTSIQPVTTCVKMEFLTFRTSQVEELRKLESKRNAGWRIAYEVITADGFYSARLEYDEMRPVAPTTNTANARIAATLGAQFGYQIQPVEPVPAPTMTVNRQETRAINFGTDIANARATLNLMLCDDEVNHADFVLNVRRSRLPRQEQDALVAESLKLRAGKKVGETFRDMAELKPHVRSPFAARQVVNS